MSEEIKNCFVISPIGESESETRKRADQVLKHIIKPAAKECGYEAVRSDEIDKPGIITSQVIQKVVSDPLVIADLTETNPNVFYELAIRHAIKKPLVQLIQKGERIPFDVAGTRTISFDHHDLDSVAQAKKEIIEQIKSFEVGSTEMETPISVALDLQVLRQSEKPEARSLADIVSAITDVRSVMVKLEEKIISIKEKPSEQEYNIQKDDWIRKFSRELSIRTRSRAYDNFAIKDFLQILPKKVGGHMSILVVSSVYKEQFPWLYEIGMEVYRKASAGDMKGAKQLVKQFQMVAELTMRGSWADDTVNKRDLFFLLDELPYLMDKVIDFENNLI
ncbi:MAG: hypothetical protein HQM06_04015 [Magnetococcales bacterium]|nr:hypothetical protein [Magnetococcales bacterium]